MQFNNNSDNQDILSLVGDATGINTTVHIQEVTRACNRANKMIWSWIFQSYGGWQYDDANQTNSPFATTALVSGQAKYKLPTEALTINSAELKNENGDWEKLYPRPIRAISDKTSEEEYEDEDGQPRYYALVGEEIKLYPAPDYSQANSIRINFDRGSVSFVSTDTEKDPGFVSEFHEAVADGASCYIAINKKLANVQGLREQWFQWEPKIKQFYSERFGEKYPPAFRKGDFTRNVI